MALPSDGEIRMNALSLIGWLIIALFLAGAGGFGIASGWQVLPAFCIVGAGATAAMIAFKADIG